ncbi:MAG: FliH/SctL family protein [Paracoccaceae bacterium]
MNEVQEDTISETNEKDFKDLQSLLEAANLSEFNPETGYTEEKQDFVKFESFFDIVKSTISDEVEVQEKKEGEELEVLAHEQEDTSLDQERSEKDLKKDLNEDENEIEPEDLDLTQVDIKEETPGVEDENSLRAEAEVDNDEAQNGKAQPSSNDEIEDTDDKSDAVLDDPIISEAAFDSELEKNAYEKGHRAALEEFESSMELEKKSLQDLTETLFLISEKFQEDTVNLIKQKLLELSDELIGANIKEFQENFLNKIELAAESIIAEVRGATLELNHSDLKILQENSKVKDFGFQLLEKSDLRRGEFRLIIDSLGFEQKIIE